MHLAATTEQGKSQANSCPVLEAHVTHFIFLSGQSYWVLFSPLSFWIFFSPSLFPLLGLGSSVVCSMRKPASFIIFFLPSVWFSYFLWIWYHLVALYLCIPWGCSLSLNETNFASEILSTISCYFDPCLRAHVCSSASVFFTYGAPFLFLCP